MATPCSCKIDNKGYRTVEFESACIIMVTLWDLVPATKYLHGKAKNSNQALLIRGVTRIFEPRRQ